MVIIYLDLIGNIYLVVDLPSISKFIDVPNEMGSGNSLISCVAWCEKVGFKIIKNVSLEIGSKIVDSCVSDWFNIWHEITTPLSKRKGFDKMIGNITELTKLSSSKNAYSLKIIKLRQSVHETFLN